MANKDKKKAQQVKQMIREVFKKGPRQPASAGVKKRPRQAHFKAKKEQQQRQTNRDQIAELDKRLDELRASRAPGL